MDEPKGPVKSVSEESLRRKGYEASDAQISPIIAFIVALILLIVLSLVGMVFLFDWLEDSSASRDRKPSTLATDQIPPEPRLDTTPRGDLDSVQSIAQERLNGYAWIDQDAGVVQIPIEKAMELLVERGLPTRGATDSGGGTAGESR